MEPGNLIHLELNISRGRAAALLSGLLLCAGSLALDSETLTMSTTYPAPSGIYQTLTTTGGTAASPQDTRLARDAGNVLLVPPTNPGGAAGGQVGIGVAAPAMKLDIAQGAGLRLGQAYLSSGGDFTHLANNEWYDGAAWHTNGNPGVLYQQTGQSSIWYKHDAAGVHAGLMTLDSAGNLYANDLHSASGNRWLSQIGLATTSNWNSGTFNPGAPGIIAVYATCPGGYFATGGSCYDPYHIYANYTNPANQTHYCYYFQLACPNCWGAQVMCARIP